MNVQIVSLKVAIAFIVVFCSHLVDGSTTVIRRRRTYYPSRGGGGVYYSSGHYYGVVGGGGGGLADPTMLIIMFIVIVGIALLFIVSIVISSIYRPDDGSGVVVEEDIQVIHHDPPPYQQYAQGPQQYAQPAQAQIVMVQPKASAMRNNNVHKSMSSTTNAALRQKNNGVSVKPSVSKANPAQLKAQQPAKLNALSTFIRFSLRDGSSSTADECNRLLTSLADLRDVLTNRDLSFVRTDAFLQPFLDVIQSQVTTDVVTTRSLQAVDKFINAGLIPSNDSATKAVEGIAIAVTEAKFAESDYNKADEVVYSMIQVLHSLLRAPCGCFLKYEQICKMLHCLFRVCFDTSLTSLLLAAARSALADMTRILFTRFMTHNSEDILKSMHELLRFSVSLVNPLDSTNVESMRMVGLNLITIGLETSIDYVCKYPNLVTIIKDDLCKSLLQLLSSSKIFLFSMANRLCYLLFICDSLRPQLKFQLESYFTTLMSIIGNELSSFDRKEIALESVVHLFRVPNLVSELYLNYDCGLYCSNLFEDLTKILSDNAFPTGGHILSTHLLSLEAILTVIGQICTNAVPTAPMIAGDYPEVVVHGGPPNKKQAPSNPTPPIPSISEVITQKKKKRIITEGTELFNRNAKKGLEYLCDHGILKTPLDAKEVAGWLRENPHLDKMKIADCICDRKNTEILRAFVESFPFEGTRLDEALRMFVESFRLPGEAAEIAKIIQQFADHWFLVNNEPFGHPDAAFTLAYAIIMLNVDQHNPQVRRNQPPMTLEAFRKNVSGTNHGGDFDPDMLQEIYDSIKSNEIVMPAEQTGAIRENYLWKILQKRAESWEGVFQAAAPGCNDRDLFNTIWGPATAALSYIFDRSEEKSTLLKALNGYGNCATVAAYYGMTDVFDNLIIHLCKFSTLMGTFEAPSNLPPGAKDDSASPNGRHSSSMRDLIANSPDQTVYAFAENYRAQIATRLMFELMRKHGDNLRAGWKKCPRLCSSIVPNACTSEFVDYGRRLFGSTCSSLHSTTTNYDFFRWLPFGMSSEDPKSPTPEQENLKKMVISLVEDCHLEELIAGGRHLTLSALNELVISVIHWSLVITGHDAITTPSLTSLNSNDEQHSASDKNSTSERPTSMPSANEPPMVVVLSRQDEDELVFLLELLMRISMENKYRIGQICPLLTKHFHWLLLPFGWDLFVVERVVVSVMRFVNCCLLPQLLDASTTLHPKFSDWEQLFELLIFPLLRVLQAVPIVSLADVGLLEEMRVRVMQWAVRLFLNRLETIAALQSFPNLVTQLIGLMERYINAALSEVTRETIPQTLKNMIQVLDNSRLFESRPALRDEVQRLLDTFVPELKNEIFPPAHQEEFPVVPQVIQPNVPTQVPQNMSTNSPPPPQSYVPTSPISSSASPPVVSPIPALSPSNNAMPLPAALLQRLQKRGIVPKPKDDEEVFIESYDGAPEDADEKDEQTRPRSGAPGCPNRWNEYHLCTDFCYDHWQEGMPESRLSERYQQAKRTMLARYPLPDGWKEVYDAGVRRHYYWCPSTDEVCWLSPNHPLANITEAAPQVAKRHFAESKRHSQVDELAEEHGNKRQRGKERNRRPEVNVSDNDEEDALVEKRAKAIESHSRDESNFNLAARNTEVEISDRDRMKKALKKKMDPMDPASYSDAPAGNWSTGLTSEAKTGVDVTATGPLFQSRPYPNPGAILRKKEQSGSNEK
ncbi:Golgi-specific brefeldin A-resistance guanine nucleotide exchange factor 1 [Aphelenchoides besseyi]|nr:Golgi-specific brefeldin A-resistance guanine nucleotide exchange factor 1 [Aphelenchoides besseyi]